MGDSLLLIHFTSGVTIYSNIIFLQCVNLKFLGKKQMVLVLLEDILYIIDEFYSTNHIPLHSRLSEIRIGVVRTPDCLDR